MFIPVSFNIFLRYEQIPYVDQTLFSLFLSEMDVLERIGDNPFIVKLIGGAVSPKFMCILTEFEPGGNLETFLATAQIQPELRVRIILDVARGMRAIHRAGVIHRNLKPINVMMVAADLHAPVVCRVTDFGFSRMASEGTMASTMTAGVGSPLYMAPELAAGDPHYGKKADVYSFAISCVEIWNSARAFSEYNMTDPFAFMAAVAHQGIRPGIKSDCPVELCNLIQQCWATEASARPDFDDITTQILQQFPFLSP